MTMSEIKGMAVATLIPMTGPDAAVHDWDHTIATLNSKLKTTWEAFIDSLLREWKTLNIVSVLLLSAILTILQIQAVADDPIARHAALLSLVCALMSLLFGGMYIIRFGGMRKAYKAAEWAAEAQKTKTLIWWNVWVLLAMPVIWLAWSIILYIICIVAFVWRAGTTDPPYGPLSPRAALGPRLAISSVLGLGLIYFLLVLNTFRRYGDDMDKAWSARVAGWAREKLSNEKRYHAYPNESRRPRSYTSSYSPTVYDPLPGVHPLNRPPSPQNLASTQYAMPYDQSTGFPPAEYVQVYPPAQNMQYYPPAQSLQDYPTVQSIHIPPTPSVRRHRSRRVSRLWRSEESRENLPSLQVPRPSNEIYWSNPDYNFMAPSFGHGTVIIPSSDVFFQTFKVMDLRFLSRDGNPMPDVLSQFRIQVKDWMQFISEATHEWTGEVPLCLWDSDPSGEIVRPQDAVAGVVERWNSKFFYPRGVRAFLCYEHTSGYPVSSGFAIYLADWLSSGSQPPDLEGRFQSVLEDLEQIDIYDPPLDTSRMTFSRFSMFSTRRRVRGRVHVGISLKKTKGPDPERLIRPSSPLTTITEVTERSSRSRPFPTIVIPGSANPHPEQIVSRERSRSSKSSERRSRWSRSPQTMERLAPSNGEASDLPGAEPSSSLPGRTPSSAMSTFDRPRQSPDAEIRRWTYGVQSQTMHTTDNSQPAQQSIIYISSASDARPTDQHETIVDHELRPHTDDRSRPYRGQSQVIHGRTDPREFRDNPSSPSRRRSTSQPSRHSHRYHSVPVGYSTHLPSEYSSRRSTARVVSDGRTHRSKASTHSPLPHTMSYQADSQLNSVGTPSITSGPPPPTLPHTIPYQWDQVYPPVNSIGAPSMSFGPPPPTLPPTMSYHREQANLSVTPVTISGPPSPTLPYLTSYNREQSYYSRNSMGIPSTHPGPLPTQPIINESHSIDQDGASRDRTLRPPLLSPLPMKPMSIEFEEGLNRTDVDDGQCSTEEQVPVGQPSPGLGLRPSGGIEGPWKRDIDSLHFILGNG